MKDLQEAVNKKATALDGVIAHWLEKRAASGRRIFCAAGCSNCCTLFVQSTLIEAMIVAERLDETYRKKLEDYVLRQQGCLSGCNDFLTILREHRSEIGPCPFLDNTGCCSIYAQRPLACRALLSTKPSEWCSVDFSNLDPLEKRLYLESLERSVVAFPMHYVEITQDAAQSAEERLQILMETQFGWAIRGNFPLLVYLAYSTDLVNNIEINVKSWPEIISKSEFFHPLLVQITPITEK